MVSTHQLRGRSPALVDSGLVVSFNKDWQWRVYVELGYVRSLPDFTGRRIGADLSYPKLRVTENGTRLATVGFDPNTADITIDANDPTSHSLRHST